MDSTNHCVSSVSADPVRMALTPSRSGFVDIDLTPLKSSSEVALVPQAMGPATGLLSQNAPLGSRGFTLPTLVVTPSGTSIGQLHPPISGETKPSVINGNSGMVQSLNQPVPISDTTVTSKHCPSVDVRAVVTKNCSGASDPGNPAVIHGGKCQTPPSGQTSVSAVTSCPTHVDCRAMLITEAAAKQAFQEYGESQFCYRGTPAKEMTTEELLPLNTYRYSLETFTESRTCEWVTEKYTGQHVDSTNVRSAIQPSQIPVAVPEMFKDCTQKMKVPNTSSVKACSQCKGMGKDMCLKCHGTARIQCMWCNGTGRRTQMEMCQQCYGSGAESCRMCNNTVAQNCVTCAGKGQILTYMQLNITCISNTSACCDGNLPCADLNGLIAKDLVQLYAEKTIFSDLFKTVHGDRIFTDEQLSVSPLADFPDSSINWASQNALEQHRTQFSSSCRVLRQRQMIELIPLTKVHYIWKGNQLNYYVYGKENKVYVKNYPEKCCCAVM